MIDLRTFYQDHYDKTLERKNAINNSLSVLVGIITALIAALFYGVSNFHYFLADPLTVIFIVLSIASSYLLGRSIYHLTLALSDFQGGYNYAYMSSSNLNTYYNELIEYYKTSTDLLGSKNVDKANAEFNTYLIQLLIKAASTNQTNNNIKNKNRFKCYQFLIYSIVTLSLLIIPFMINLILNR